MKVMMHSMKVMMHSMIPVLRLWRDLFLGDAERAQYEREQREQRLKAREEAEAEYHRRMANFYTDRVLAIDQHTDWWGYAEAKQKQYDHQCECLRHERRASGDETDYTDIPALALAIRRESAAVA